MGREKAICVMVRHRERGNRESRGTAGPCEYTAKLVTSPVGRRRRVEF